MRNIKMEKEYEFIIRPNESVAHCRACRKHLAFRRGIILEGTDYWKQHNGVILCKDCLPKIISAAETFLKDF